MYCKEKVERPAQRCVLYKNHVGGCRMESVRSATVINIERREKEIKILGYGDDDE